MQNCIMHTYILRTRSLKCPNLQTTESVTTTVTTVLYCYTTEKKLLKKTGQCSSVRRKKAIEVNGIKGFISKNLAN